MTLHAQAPHPRDRRLPFSTEPDDGFPSCFLYAADRGLSNLGRSRLTGFGRERS